MGWILVVLFAVGVWIAIRSGRKSEDAEDRITVSIETSVGRSSFDSDRVVDSGNVQPMGEAAYCINPKSPFPVTLRHLSNSDATEAKRILDGEVRWERRLNEFTVLIAQHNVECVELEEFISQARSEVSAYIENRKRSSEEWDGSSEKDKADLILEFQTAALTQLETRPSNDRAVEALIFGEPGDVTADDELLAVFSGEKELYQFYVTTLGHSSRVNQVAADDYYRKSWESLVNLGLAIRGKEIPVEALLDGLRVKDINSFFSDRLEKKLTRKAKAVEFAAAQPDVLDVLSNHISFREAFQISEPEGVEISAIKKCYEYAAAQAEVIRDTYVSGCRTLDALEDSHNADYGGWVIEADECCRHCAESDGKKTKRRPAKVPPFHVGCTCSLDRTYD